MGNNIYSIIEGTGAYIPTEIVKNEDFLNHDFFDENGVRIDKDTKEIIEKFQQITQIEERRYITDDLVTSDIGFFAAEDALKSSNTDKEDLDYIIVAHNFGDIKADNKKSDLVPSIAARIKHKLGIKNPNTIAYDLPFGCPGWLQGVIQADYYIKSGDAKKILVVGSETLSRVCDPHDRDSMIYSDGAGAVLLGATESDTPIGIMAHKTRTDTLDEVHMLNMGGSDNPAYVGDELFLKMRGRKLYQYALNSVPQAIKDCLEKSNTHLSKIKSILIHQANGKMDEAILKRLYDLYEKLEIPNNIMPMTISWLGNSSVATLPTLLDLILKGNFNPYKLNQDDTVIFASVGAGMNINALIYKFK
ncbi:MAG: 3-oxoacyl-[acyl-carrier-protein] synthase-3 [Parvicellaceae bacterium]|jgi:3-oxoacyl-[acyl-carrier-protein] synthase-3